MANALQFLDPYVDSAKSTSHQLTPRVKLPVGDNFQTGDLRLVFLVDVFPGGTTGDIVTMTFTSGWTRLLYQANGGTFAGQGHGACFSRVLTVGDVDGYAVWPGQSFVATGAEVSPSCVICAITARNWNSAQTLSVTMANASGLSSGATTAYNSTASSVSVFGGGVLINAFLSVNGQIETIPSGSTQLGASSKSGSNFALDANDDATVTGNGALLSGQSYASNGTSGTKVVSVGGNPDNSANTYPQNYDDAYAFSIALQQAPDQSFSVAGVTETDTPGTITLATTGATSFPVAAVTETDTPGVILFKTQSQWTDWDILPGDPVQNSLLTWTVIPGSAGSTVTVKTSIDNGATWQLAVNGGPIPNLNKGNTTATSAGYQVTETRVNAGDTPAQVSDFWPRIAVDDGYDEMLPLGTFVINAQDVVESGGSSGGGAGGSGGAGSSGVAGGGGTTAGGGMAVTLTAPDYSYIISRRTWDDVFFVAGGTNVMDAVAQIARNRMPDVKLNLGSTPHTLQGPMVFGSDQGQNDPWNDLKELVASIGWEIYFNVWGELTTRPTPDPATDAPVWTISDGSDGNRPTICGYTKTVDDATTFSHVIAQGESTNNPSGLPVMAEWFNIDPASNTNIYSDFGDVTTVYQSVLLGTTVQCQQAADAIGRFSSGTEETLKLDHLPVPFLEQSDLVTVVRPLAGISGVYQINGWTFPLGPNGVQSSDIYRQKAG